MVETITSNESALEVSYQKCEDKARTSNFYSGFRLLPSDKRRAFCAVYAFMRDCDDISDNEAPLEEKRGQFAQAREVLEQALDGQLENHPTLPALRDTVERYRIPRGWLLQLLHGTEMDLVTTRYETFEDLRRYCYSVASVVGLICIQVFGYSEDRARECAEACGLAFQLTNILRDIKEDFQRGRIYLPEEDLLRFGYSAEDLGKAVMDERYHALMAFEDQRARAYYEQARPLVRLISRDSRPAFRAMFHSYATILRRIRDRNYEVFSERIRLRPRDKLLILLRAYL